MVYCFQCKSFQSSINALRFPFVFKHKRGVYQYYKCAESGCNGRSYCSWTAFRHHLKVNHQVPLNFIPNKSDKVAGLEENHLPVDIVSGGVVECPVRDVQEPEGFSNLESGSESSDDEWQECDQDLEKVNSVDILRAQVSTFMCELYDDPVIPRNRVQNIFERVLSMLSVFTSNVQSEVTNVVMAQAHGDTEKTCNELDVFFQSLQNPLFDFGTEFRRFKLLKEKGLLIERSSFNIDSSVGTVRKGDEMIVDMIQSCGQSLSMKQTLKLFMELPSVFDTVREVLNSKPDDRIISQFIHGFHWLRKKDKYFKDKFVVPLYLYYDDFQTDKPISHHSAEEGAVYYSVASLPLKFQGRLENIFTACLFNAADCKDFGMSKAFSNVIAQLNDLQDNGILVRRGETEERVYFTVGIFIGDNLALHGLFGFTQGFTANYSCRICSVFKAVMHSQMFEDPGLLRDPIQHLRDIELNDLSATGVSERSASYDLNYFDPIENPSVDTLHDVWIGGAAYDMHYILYYLIFVAKYFTVDTLNFRILGFCFKSFSNKVPQFSADSIQKKSFRLTGSEMFTFVMCLAMLIGDLVTDPTDKVWIFYLKLRSIVDFLQARYIRKDSLKCLSDFVAEHHELYVTLFADNLKPKHHLWVHFARIILESGALRLFSCSRGEASHQSKVQTAKSTRSRRNISVTLAIKEQLRMAHRFQTGAGLEDRVIYGPKIQSTLYAIPPEFSKFSNQYKYIQYNGIVYRKNDCIILDYDDNNMPVFGVIQRIFFNENKNILFAYVPLITHMLSSHMHAYIVSKRPDVKFVLQETLLNPFPILFCCACDGQYYATFLNMDV